MRLLFISADINQIGGIEKYNRDFLNALTREKVEVLLVTRKKGGFLAKLNFLASVIRTYILHRPNIIHCAHLNFAPICQFLKLLFRAQYTLALYGIEIPTAKGWLRRRSIREAMKVITISEYSKSLILEELPQLGNKIYMLPSAVDGSKFKIKSKQKQLIKQHNLENRSVILSLARLSAMEHKGQDRVVRAMLLVLKKFPEAVYLIVGSGEDKRVSDLLIEFPELQNSVKLIGPVRDSERIDYYNLADIYVLPSKFEGFGIVFIESLACGVPVVASDGYGCREGLLQGELGFLVPPDDIGAISAAIIEFLSKKAPSNFYNREYLRKKAMSIYGLDNWNSQVSDLIKLIS